MKRGDHHQRTQLTKVDRVRATRLGFTNRERRVSCARCALDTKFGRDECESLLEWSRPPTDTKLGRSNLSASGNGGYGVTPANWGGEIGEHVCDADPCDAGW